MPEGQRHLTHTGRCRIHALMKSGLSGGAIARQLGRDRTTVSYAQRISTDQGRWPCRSRGRIPVEKPSPAFRRRPAGRRRSGAWPRRTGRTGTALDRIRGSVVERGRPVLPSASCVPMDAGSGNRAVTGTGAGDHDHRSRWNGRARAHPDIHINGRDGTATNDTDGLRRVARLPGKGMRSGSSWRPRGGCAGASRGRRATGASGSSPSTRAGAGTSPGRRRAGEDRQGRRGGARGLRRRVPGHGGHGAGRSDG